MMPPLITYKTYPFTKSLEDIAKELTVELHTQFGTSYKAVYPDVDGCFRNPDKNIKGSVQIHWYPPGDSKDYYPGNQTSLDVLFSFGRIQRVPRRVYRIHHIGDTLHLVKGIRLSDKMYFEDHEEVLDIIKKYMKNYVKNETPYSQMMIDEYEINTERKESFERIIKTIVCVCFLTVVCLVVLSPLLLGVYSVGYTMYEGLLWIVG